MASTAVVGTIVAETIDSGDQNTPAEVVPDPPAQSTSVEVNAIVEPEPPKTVFAVLPEKVPFVDPIPIFFSLAHLRL